MREWRNWYTRTIEVRMEQSLEVQVLSRAQQETSAKSQMNSTLLKREKLAETIGISIKDLVD